MENETRQCPRCEKPIRGRADKKFCSDDCRNTFNNQLNSPQRNFIRRVNRTLIRNRRILDDLLPGGKNSLTCLRQSLIQQGFDFRFHTHEETLKDGNKLHCCYEFGFVAIDAERVRVLTRRPRRP